VVKGLPYCSDSRLKSTAEKQVKKTGGFQDLNCAWWRDHPLCSLCWDCCARQREAQCLSLDYEGSVTDERASNLLITIRSTTPLQDQVCASSPYFSHVRLMAAGPALVCINLPSQKQLLELGTIQLSICWSLTSSLKRSVPLYGRAAESHRLVTDL